MDSDRSDECTKVKLISTYMYIWCRRLVPWTLTGQAAGGSMASPGSPGCGVGRQDPGYRAGPRVYREQRKVEPEEST